MCHKSIILTISRCERVAAREISHNTAVVFGVTSFVKLSFWPAGTIGQQGSLASPRITRFEYLTQVRWHRHNGTGTMTREQWHKHNGTGTSTMAWARAQWHRHNVFCTGMLAQARWHGHGKCLAVYAWQINALSSALPTNGFVG